MTHTHQPSHHSPPAHSIGYNRVVDLSHPISAAIPLWPGDPPVQFKTTATLAEHGYFLRRLTIGEHTGTHLASPSTYYPHGSGPDALPPERLVLPALVIDASRPAASNPDYALSVADLTRWERSHAVIPAGALLCLHTGWHRRWHDPARFINQDTHGIMHTPGFSLDVARLLLSDRRVAGLATDAPGIDPGTDATLSVSRLALTDPNLVLECVNNLDRLPPIGATIIVGRLNLIGGSGSPVSLLALTP